MALDKNLDYLNEGLDSRSEYRFYLDRGVLWIWFYVGADRKRKTTSVACPQVVDAPFRSEVRTRAHEIVTSARAGRVLEATAIERVQVASALDELVDAWKKEQEKHYPDSWKTRHIQINNVVTVMKELDNGLATPLQRLASDDGPQAFVDTRMRQVSKETVKKEHGVLMHFLEWLAAPSRKYISAVPPRAKYRAKDLGTRVGPQREAPVDLDDVTALAIINQLPEYGHRGGRRHNAKLPKSAFVLRDWYRFAFETGLRPSTVARLRVGIHWVRGWNNLRIDAKIDKGRNALTKGKPRIVPLTDVAAAILEKHAPDVGLIFGKHDIRVQWKRAAIAVLGEELGSQCAPYDLRHGANYRMRETVGGGVAGSMHMLGQSKASTNDLYLRGSERAAKDLVERLNARNAELEKPQRGRRKRA